MKKIIVIIIALGILGFGYFIFLGKNNGDKNVKKEENVSQDSIVNEVPKTEKKEDLAADSKEPRIIKIQAKQFQFSQDIINIKKGEKVRIVVEDGDLPHGIMIPELIHPPTQESYNEIDLMIDKPGEYKFYCANEMCGEGHGKMIGRIVVS